MLERDMTDYVKEDAEARFDELSLVPPAPVTLSRAMTVGELRAVLAEQPDDLPVHLVVGRAFLPLCRIDLDPFADEGALLLFPGRAEG